MTAVASFDDVLLKMATKGSFHSEVAATQLNPTAANSTSGFANPSTFWCAYGTSLPGTLVGLSRAPLTTAHMLDQLLLYVNNTRGLSLGWIYKIGTVDFTATGDRFTHDAATFPVLRTRMGQASQPVPLFPFLFMTVANSATAPAFLLKTGAGGNGYTDQGGNGTVGTKTFTFPAAAILAQSEYALTIEDGDYAVQDVTQINVTTAGTGGTASVYGYEPLVHVSNPYAGGATSVTDMLGESLAAVDMSPAVATSGSVTAQLVVWGYGSPGGSATCFIQHFSHKNT